MFGRSTLCVFAALAALVFGAVPSAVAESPGQPSDRQAGSAVAPNAAAPESLSGAASPKVVNRDLRRRRGRAWIKGRIPWRNQLVTVQYYNYRYRSWLNAGSGYTNSGGNYTFRVVPGYWYLVTARVKVFDHSFYIDVNGVKYPIHCFRWHTGYSRRIFARRGRVYRGMNVPLQPVGNCINNP